MSAQLVERLLKFARSAGSGWVMFLLLALSMGSIGMMIERLIYFRRNSADVGALSDRLTALLEAGDQEGAEKLLAHSRAVEAGVILGALHWIKGGPESFMDAVDSQLQRKKKDLERGMNYLGTLGSNAPFIGLFGTVIGVIVSFDQLSAGTDKSAMNNVMAGIAEALVATGVGLFVAIPAVVAYNVFQKWIGDIEGNVHSMAKQITAFLRARIHEGSSGSEPTRRPRGHAGHRHLDEVNVSSVGEAE